ncbi:hypothetical protein ABC795_04215 [Blastococcus sp. HT6-30]|uniref:hypothetical protein n=1 Tax=Blastococcus sp. HT6-30 TaxID=3144843 RepID=UPI00321970AD
MEELGAAVWLLLIVMVVLVQMALIAVSVHWGTSAIRRELLELRREVVFLERD